MGHLQATLIGVQLDIDSSATDNAEHCTARQLTPANDPSGF
jgi:hypothetical protein